MMSVPFRTAPLSASVGLEVIGLDLSRPLSGEVQSELFQLFASAGVLLFRGVGTSSKAHVDLSRCFGELERHSVKESWIEGFPELIDISYRPVTGGDRPDLQPVYEIGGEAVAGWLPWHTDQCFMPRLSRGGVLRALEVPPARGRTGFMDKVHLYETLSERLKQRIGQLRVVYRFDPRMDRQKYIVDRDIALLTSSKGMDAVLLRLESDFPPAVHPLVYDADGAGKKVLNFSPCYAIGIQGMADAESDPLLRELSAHCSDPRHAYFHEWQPDDQVVWDNWRTSHCAEGTLIDHTRIMHRTSIAGDYGLGAAA